MIRAQAAVSAGGIACLRSAAGARSRAGIGGWALRADSKERTQVGYTAVLRYSGSGWSGLTHNRCRELSTSAAQIQGDGGRSSPHIAEPS